MPYKREPEADNANSKRCIPAAVFSTPSALPYSAYPPMAVLRLPSVFEFRAKAPVAVLMLPVGVRKAAGTSEPGVLLIHLPRARSL